MNEEKKESKFKIDSIEDAIECMNELEKFMAKVKRAVRKYDRLFGTRRSRGYGFLSRKDIENIIWDILSRKMGVSHEYEEEEIEPDKLKRIYEKIKKEEEPKEERNAETLASSTD